MVTSSAAASGGDAGGERRAEGEVAEAEGHWRILSEWCRARLSGGTSAQRQSRSLEGDEQRVGGEPEEGEQEDRREHQRDLEVELGVHHLEAHALVGADHLGGDEQQQRGGGRQPEPDEDRRHRRRQHDAAEDGQARGAVAFGHLDQLAVDLLHAADGGEQHREERCPENHKDLRVCPESPQRRSAELLTVQPRAVRSP